MPVAERPREEAEDGQCGICGLQALSKMVSILRIVDIVLFTVRGEERSMQKYAGSVVQ